MNQIFTMLLFVFISSCNNHLKIKGIEIDTRSFSVNDDFVSGIEKMGNHEIETYNLIRLKNGEIIEFKRDKERKIFIFNYTKQINSAEIKNALDNGTHLTYTYESPLKIEVESENHFFSSLEKHETKELKACNLKGKGKRRFICLNNKHLLIMMVDDFVHDCKIKNAWGHCLMAGGVSFSLTSLGCDGAEATNLMEQMCFENISFE
jgi:hypothetical protein